MRRRRKSWFPARTVEAEPVVAGEPAARARLQAAEVEVALVVDDEELLRRDLEEPNGRRDRPARQVHVELGLQQPESKFAIRELPQADRKTWL